MFFYVFSILKFFIDLEKSLTLKKVIETLSIFASALLTNNLPKNKFFFVPSKTIEFGMIFGFQDFFIFEKKITKNCHSSRIKADTA